MRRVAPIARLMVLLACCAVALQAAGREAAAMAVSAVVAVILFAVCVDAVGAGLDDSVLLWRVTADRKRTALSRLATRGRDWDRRAPDAPDEPADRIWQREAERRRSRC